MLRFIPLLFLLLASHVQAQLPSFGSTRSEARMVSEVTAIAPGQPFTVALHLSHPDEWHSYYKNSGGIELPPSIEWTLPEGFTAGAIQWPVPAIKPSDYGTSLIYNGSPAFLIEITPPSELSAETVTLTASAHWQICKQSCIDEQGDFILNLSVSAEAQTDASEAAFFTDARSKLPSSAILENATAIASGSTIELSFTPPPGASPDSSVGFVPDQPFLQPAIYGDDIQREKGTWTITLERNTVDLLDNPIPQEDAFTGILSFQSDSGDLAVFIPETSIGELETAATPLPDATPLHYFRILWGMFIGGLLLNLMPCVFPVIGLKIMGFVQQAGEDQKKIMFHGLTFTLGVLLSFAVISGILFAARSLAGGGASWGYQLQNPWIVLALMLLMFVLALNMFGIFEIGASATSVGGNLQHKQGFAGSFFSGVLATVVATPCSAPFLGVAIGAAVALPATQFFGAFAAMAIGLSFPYLLLSAFPKLIRFLPRPGAWMESFKQAMSFLLFATAGYLLWVYAGQIGLDKLLPPIFGLSAIAIACWVYGRWHLPHLKRSVRLAALSFTVVFALTGVWLAKPPAALQSTDLVWETWSQEKVDTLLAEGTPVYIDFTAQWCVTCQVNKKRAYTPEVVALMHEKNIVALQADKTKASPAIDAKLAELGRSAIPVNVLFTPGKEPVITPELLSPGYLIDLFNREVP